MRNIITAILILWGFSSFGQTTPAKPDTTKKPVKEVFTPDWKTTLAVSLNIKAADLNSYFFVLQQGGPPAMAQSQTLSARDAGAYVQSYSTVLDSMSAQTFRAYSAWFKAAQAKFSADTLAKHKNSKLIH